MNIESKLQGHDSGAAQPLYLTYLTSKHLFNLFNDQHQATGRLKHHARACDVHTVKVHPPRGTATATDIAGCGNAPVTLRCGPTAARRCGQCDLKNQSYMQ